MLISRSLLGIGLACLCNSAAQACAVGTAVGSQCQTYITATGTFTLPTDWPSIADQIACLGSGGTGSARVSSSRGGSGGGGGEYAAETNVALTSNASVVIGTAGGTTNTSFPADIVTVTAHFGATGTTSTAGAGGTGSSNAVHFNGGVGLLPATSTAYGGGGGGAAGSSGAGGAGTTDQGGAADNGVVGRCTVTTSGVAGPSGTEWDGTHGSGSGGCGPSAGSGSGGAGGSYGGGGSGAGDSATGNTGGAGQAGICRVLYTPLVTYSAAPNEVCNSQIVVNQTASRDLRIFTNTGYFCSIILISATAQNYNLVDGTGTLCGTSTGGIFGGTTAALGLNSAANTIVAAGGERGIVAKMNASAHHLCLLQSGTGQISGVIRYVDH